MNKIVKLICALSMMVLVMAISVSPNLEAAKNYRVRGKSRGDRRTRIVVRASLAQSQKNRKRVHPRHAARIAVARGKRKGPHAPAKTPYKPLKIEVPATPARAHHTTVKPKPKPTAAHTKPARPSTPVVNHETDAADMGRKALEYTNQFRATKGLPPLQWNQALADAGLIHSQNMGNGIVAWGHGGFHERIASLPFRSRAAAENLFMCNHRGDRAKLAVDGWIGSPGHYKNLVGNYTHCGIGVYKNSAGFWYFTQLFSTPL